MIVTLIIIGGIGTIALIISAIRFSKFIKQEMAKVQPKINAYKEYVEFLGDLNKRSNKMLEAAERLNKASKEQNSYMALELARAKMLDYHIQFSKNQVFSCHPYPDPMLLNGTKFIHEKYFYLCHEILEGKHNEFLKKIIEATEKLNTTNNE